MPDPTKTAVAAGGVAVTAGTIAYYYDAAKRAYVTPSGAYLRQAVVRANWQRVLATARKDIEVLTQQLRDGVISLAEWQRAMAQKIKVIHVTSATARGGWMQMSQSDWGYVGSRVKRQYAYLQNFADQVASGAQPLNGNLMRRSGMYADAGRATQEALRRRMMGDMGVTEARRHLGLAEHCDDCVEYADRGWQPIDSLPEIGDSQCMCILSNSPVLTARGYVPLLDVQVGDLVWTHKERWRPVTGLVVKPSLPTHRAACVNGVWVTEDHLWFGPDGWVSALDIGNSDILLYTNGRRAEYHANMYEMRGKDTDNARQGIWPLSGVQERDFGMCLWDTQGLPGEDVPFLRAFAQSQEAMGRELGYDTCGDQGGWYQAPHAIRGLGAFQLADEGRRAPLQLVLAGGGDQKANSLPLSVGMDHGERSNPGWLCGAPRELGPLGRPTRQFGVDDKGRACHTALCAATQAPADLDMSTLRPAIPILPARQAARPEVLLEGLPLRAPLALFDLTVAEDHSFLIGNLFAHNTNCKCFFQYRPPSGEVVE